MIWLKFSWFIVTYKHQLMQEKHIWKFHKLRFYYIKHDSCVFGSRGQIENFRHQIKTVLTALNLCKHCHICQYVVPSAALFQICKLSFALLYGNETFTIVGKPLYLKQNMFYKYFSQENEPQLIFCKIGIILKFSHLKTQ